MVSTPPWLILWNRSTNHVDSGINKPHPTHPTALAHSPSQFFELPQTPATWAWGHRASKTLGKSLASKSISWNSAVVQRLIRKHSCIWCYIIWDISMRIVDIDQENLIWIFGSIASDHFTPKISRRCIAPPQLYGPGLVDGPRSSKKCMALSQLKVSASKPLLGTWDRKFRWLNWGMTNENENHLERQEIHRNTVTTKNFTLNFSKLFSMLRSEWPLYMFITVLSLSYLISWM